MKLVSIFLVLQVLLLATVPVWGQGLDAACCTTPCEQEENLPLSPEKHKEESTSQEHCNPFGCVSCCFLITAPAEEINGLTDTPAAAKLFSSFTHAAPQLQYSIWHPPRTATLFC